MKSEENDIQKNTKLTWFDIIVVYIAAKLISVGIFTMFSASSIWLIIGGLAIIELGSIIWIAYENVVRIQMRDGKR